MVQWEFNEDLPFLPGCVLVKEEIFKRQLCTEETFWKIYGDSVDKNTVIYIRL